MLNIGIEFVNADNAGLLFHINTNDGEEIKRRADTIEDGVYFVKKYGLADRHFFSSDMDFASENGFTNDDDAKKMFDRIMNNVDTRALEAV